MICTDHAPVLYFQSEELDAGEEFSLFYLVFFFGDHAAFAKGVEFFDSAENIITCRFIRWLCVLNFDFLFLRHLQILCELLALFIERVKLFTGDVDVEIPQVFAFGELVDRQLTNRIGRAPRLPQKGSGHQAAYQILEDF